MKLVKGQNLTSAQVKEVKSAFVNRHLAIGPGKPYADDAAWIIDHAFYIGMDGHISSSVNYCVEVFTVDMDKNMSIMFDSVAAFDAVVDAGICSADIYRQGTTFPGVTINGIRVCVEGDVFTVSAPDARPRARFTHADEEEDDGRH